jgi:hypothetical protein
LSAEHTVAGADRVGVVRAVPGRERSVRHRLPSRRAERDTTLRYPVLGGSSIVLELEGQLRPLVGDYGR